MGIRYYKMQKGLFSSISNVLILRIFSAGLLFLFFVFISRNLGKEEVGLFFLGFACTSILSGLSSLGLYRVVVRLLGAHDQSQEGHLRKIIIIKSLLLGFITACGSSIILFYLSDFVANKIFHQLELVAIFHIMALTIVPLTISMLCGNILEGLSKPFHAVLVLNTLLPAFCLVASGLYSLTNGLNFAWQAAWLFLVGNLATMLTSLVLVFTYLSKGRNLVKEQVINITYTELLRGTVSLLLIMLTDQTIRWGGQLITGVWLSAGDVALLATAHRTAASLGLILQAINKVISPRFAALHKQGEHQKIWPVLLNTIKVSITYSLPAFLVIVFFSPLLMRVFGNGFSTGWSLLVILSFGYLVNSVTGPISQLLIMVGQEKLLRNITIITGLFTLVSAVLLTIVLGVIGSAIAICLALVMQNTIVLGQVSRLYRPKSVPLVA